MVKLGKSLYTASLATQQAGSFDFGFHCVGFSLLLPGHRHDKDSAESVCHRRQILQANALATVNPTNF
jgi:hypothetical protein